MATVAQLPRTGRGPIPITYVISAMDTEHAGTEGHILRLIRSMDRGLFDPRLVVMQRSDWTDAFYDPRIPLQVLGFRSFRRPQDWLAISNLAKCFRRHLTQIVELHFTDAHFAGAIAARIAKVPVVVSCRRDLGHQYGLKGKLLMKLGNRFVSRFLANSEAVANELSHLEGIPRSRFEVIHNGIDLTAFDRSAQQGGVDADFERMSFDKRVVAIAANLRPVKNVGCFLEAAALVAREFDDVVFAVMGDGRLKKDLQKHAQQLHIADRTIWLGSVPTVAPYLVRSHIACLSSNSEGFSNSIIEYMSAGLPVVATDVGGASEAIVHGKTGFLVPANSPTDFSTKLATILRNEEVREQMGRAARRRVEDKFTMHSQLQAHCSLYSRELGLAGV